MIRIIAYVTLIMLTIDSATSMETMKKGLNSIRVATFGITYAQVDNPTFLKEPEILSREDIPEPPELICQDLLIILDMKGSFTDTEYMEWSNNTRNLTNCLESPIFNKNIKNRSNKNMIHLPFFLATKYPLLVYYYGELSFRADYWYPFPIPNHKQDDICVSFYHILTKKQAIRFSSFLKESGITIEKGSTHALLKESEEDFKVRLQDWQESYKTMRDAIGPDSLQTKIINNVMLKSYKTV